MQKIFFLFNFQGYHQYYTYPVILARRRLRELGFDVRVGNLKLLSSIVGPLDCLVVDNTLFWKLGHDYLNQAANSLHKWRQRAGRIVWFDTGDGTGEFEFGIMEHVDLYLKAFCLKDRSLYSRTFHENRIWAEYYQQNLPLARPTPSLERTTGGVVDTNEIVVGWNYYLGVFSGWDRAVRRCGSLAPRVAQKTRSFTPVTRNRTVAVSLRGNASYVAEGREYAMVSWQRKMLSEILQGKGIDTNRLSRSHYYKELQNTRVALSPFGWGEVCLRDYEIILSGAMLMKPNMEHLETWPNLWVPQVTYWPLKWDLSDFESAIEIAEKNGRWIKIAQNAQDLYRKYLGEFGIEEFCTRLIRIIHGDQPRA